MSFREISKLLQLALEIFSNPQRTTTTSGTPLKKEEKMLIKINCRYKTKLY